MNTRMGVERCDPLRVRPRRSRASASTSPSCTRPTCSRSPATSGSGRSTRSRPSTPTSTTAYHHVDAACIYFVQDPGRYDVIVTDNLFGDILTDLGGAVVRRHRARGVGATSTRPAPVRRCSSRCTARRPTSPAPAGRSACRDHLGRDDVGVPRRGRRRGASTRRGRQVRRRRAERTAEIGDAIAGRI